MIVINLFGAACSGKSTLAAEIFYQLKKAGKNTELALEFVKDSVYDGNPYPFQDQIYVFANQLKKLRQFNGKVDYVVTDSPLLLSHIYAGEKESAEFHMLIDAEWKKYHNINFFLNHQNLSYVSEGRLDTYNDRDKISNSILIILSLFHDSYKKISVNTKIEDIMQYIEEESKKYEVSN